jgi:hypothetical protein
MEKSIKITMPATIKKEKCIICKQYFHIMKNMKNMKNKKNMKNQLCKQCFNATMNTSTAYCEI